MKKTKTMRTTTKVAVLLASGVASLTTAQAGSADLLLGFNDAAGPSSAQNDYVIDLGLNASTLVADAVGNGGTWNLSSLLNGSTFNTAFSTDANNLNNVAFGVVGGYNVPPTKYLFQTVLPGSTPALPNSGQLKNASSYAGSPTLGEYGSSSSGSWSGLVALSPTQNGIGSVASQTGNPLTFLSSGTASLELWQITGTGLQTTVGTWADLGTFNVNLNNDTVTFTVPSAVPEPSATGVLAGAGLLAVIMRQQIKRKNA